MTTNESINTTYDKTFCVTMIPGTRVSNKVKPEIRFFTSCLSGESGKLIIDFIQRDNVRKRFEYQIVQNTIFSATLDLADLNGEFFVDFSLIENEEKIRSRVLPLEIVSSGNISTGMIDGAWISIVHWSDDEAQCFNPQLKTANDTDWENHIESMHNIGINIVVIQNLFHNNAYVNQHKQTMQNYPGQSFYPSGLASSKYPIPCNDPVEIILRTADRLGMSVFAGIGMFAWFDLGIESLKWHRAVTQEIFAQYGHHPSLYGWYISEEMFGDLLEYPGFNYPGHEKDIADFFREYKSLIEKLTPTKPVLFAINNGNFNSKLEQWRTILKNIDILSPFGFARNPDNNIDVILNLCRECQTHLWVDFELFRFPFPDGLRPKDFNIVLNELNDYLCSEIVLGYQYTGILESPDSRLRMGGDESINTYMQFEKYYDRVRKFDYIIPGNYTPDYEM